MDAQNRGEMSVNKIWIMAACLLFFAAAIPCPAQEPAGPIGENRLVRLRVDDEPRLAALRSGMSDCRQAVAMMRARKKSIDNMARDMAAGPGKGSYTGYTGKLYAILCEMILVGGNVCDMIYYQSNLLDNAAAERYFGERIRYYEGFIRSRSGLVQDISARLKNNRLLSPPVIVDQYMKTAREIAYLQAAVAKLRQTFLVQAQ